MRDTQKQEVTPRSTTSSRRTQAAREVTHTATSAVSPGEVRAEQHRFRSAIARFLDVPSVSTLQRLRRVGFHYIDFERDRLLSAADRSHIGQATCDRLRRNHLELVQALETVLWDTPGSAKIRDDALALRHRLLAQIEIFEQHVSATLSATESDGHAC